MANADEAEPLRLSREDLYELVWSKSMRDLAKDFGISDVGLAKRCKGLGIPVPGRGYWARLDAGQKPHRPKLPEREAQWHDQRALTVPVTPPSQEAEGQAAENGTDGSVSAIREQICAIPIAPTLSIIDALPPVKRTAFHLKHPRRADLAFERGEKSGPLVALEVSEDALDRALLLVDTFLRTAEHLGWQFVAPPPPKPVGQPHHYSRHREQQSVSPKPSVVYGELRVAGERVGLRVEERMRDEPRTPTETELARERREYGYRAARKIQVPTGNLRLIRLDTYCSYGGHVRQTWYDRKGLRVEDQLKEVLMSCLELAQSIKVRRAKEERERIEQEQKELRQAERAKKRKAHAKLIKQLETDAGAWHRARYLRRYIQAASRALDGKPLPAVFQSLTVDFLKWADLYVNQLDPLHPAVRTGEFSHDEGGQYVTEIERLKQVFTRLLGSEWRSAWKIGADYSPAPPRRPGERLFSYRGKSVFEVEGDREED